MSHSKADPFSIYTSTRYSRETIAALARGIRDRVPHAQLARELGMPSSASVAELAGYIRRKAAAAGLSWPEDWIEAEETRAAAAAPAPAKVQEKMQDTRGDDRYEYIPQAKSYYFSLAGEDPMVFSEEVVQEWFSDYSRYSDPADKGAKIREICRKNNIRPGVFDRLKRVLDLTHEAPPFAPHVLRAQEPDDLAVETLQMREKRYFTALAKNEETFFRERYEQKMQEEVSLHAWARALAERFVHPRPVKALPPAARVTDRRKISVNLALADLHAGKKVDAGAVVGHGAEGMDRRQLDQRVDELCEWIRTQYAGKHITDAALTILGDVLESLLGTMHWGHARDIYAFGAYQVEHAVDLIERVILAMLSITPPGVPLKIAGVGGNHDRAEGDRGADPARTGFVLVMKFLQRSLREATRLGRIQWEQSWAWEDEARDTRGWVGVTVGGLRYLAHHGDRKLTAPRVINLDQQDTQLAHPTYVVLRAHLHGLELKQQLNYVDCLCPSIIGGDPYSNGQLGFTPYAGAVMWVSDPGDLFPRPDIAWLGRPPQAMLRAA
jgi:hypothetical protein